MWQFPCLPNLWFSLDISFRDIAMSLKRSLIIFNYFRSFYFVVILIETIFNSLVNKELLRDIVEANLCKIFEHVYNDLIHAYLKDKLKIPDISEDTKPGAGEVEERYLYELAGEQDSNARVLGGEEFDSEEEALDSDEGELGGVEAADDHLGSSTSEVVSTIQ